MPHRILAAIALLCALATTAHASETCRASWYGYESGRVTASGARFDPRQLTAAHRTLPFGTRLLVTYRGRSVVVTVTDRGPARWTGRCLDLSQGAAARVGLIPAGVATVTITKLN